MPTTDKNRRVTRAGAVRACGVVCVVVLAASVFAEIDRTRLALIDPLVEDAIGDGLLPGAVVVVGHAGEIVYEGAFGARAVDGLGESMTPDTIFDLASLTKVVATEGFEGAGAAIARAANEVPEAGPGERFIYSDINFFVLGEIVRLVTGQTLDQFARDRIFRPLGMKDTGFNPPSSLRPRIAPTEPCAPLAWPCGGDGAVMLRGRVHDPTARRMGGVAGHAGVVGRAQVD